jgi:Phosphotransferase enzyme family
MDSSQPHSNLERGPITRSVFRHTQVERQGDVILRTAGPWTPTIHTLLRHLEEVGFTGAPHVVGSGFDEMGRETLSYFEGAPVHPEPWSLEAAAAVGRLLRQLHEATASYRPPPDAKWRRWFGRDLGGPAKIIGHCDVAPWNIVARHGRPVGLIDWDFAGPVDPYVDLAHTAWLNASLFSGDLAERSGLPAVHERLKALRAIVDAYGVEADKRAHLIDLIIDVAVCSIANDADEAGVTRATIQSDALWGMAWRSRSAAWMVQNRKDLNAALR